MSITDLILPRSRKTVAWLGISPPVEGIQAFEERGFQVDSCTDEDLQKTEYLVGLAAVVFIQNAEKPLQIRRHLAAHAQQLLDYDCRIILRPASREIPLGSQIQITNYTSIITHTINDLRLPTARIYSTETGKPSDWQPIDDGDPPLPHARVFDTAVLWNDVANFIAAHPSGNAPRDAPYLKIDAKDKGGKDIKFDGTYPPDDPSNHDLPVDEKNEKKKGNNLNHGSELLLRRAFWDCKEVHLVAMTDGLSGVPVFRAFPEFALGQAGDGARGTRPYFVKIGDRKQIYDEYRNYVDYVGPYVPFHLGPHLVLERCCLGAEQGVIVGDLVDESESLRSCASDGRAALAIACLFNRTLHGWHSRFTEEPRSLVEIRDYRDKEYFPSAIPEARLILANGLGAKKSLAELRTLFERCSELKPVFVAPIHGDLHGANVLVRGIDAIVIDFLSHYKGPLVYDAACLEAGLLVDGFADDERDASEWLKSIMPLYDQSSLFGMPSYIHPKSPSAWFYACVRQIRLHARQMECVNGQYAAALAVILLKKSCKFKDFPERQASHRAAAYVIAERVLSRHFGNVQATKKPRTANKT